MTKRILLVEDRPSDVRLTIRAIERAGYDVIMDVAGDGKTALDRLDRPPRPDLILLDWMMPVLNGEEVLQEMKEDPQLSRIPVIVLTTSSSEIDVVSAYDKGCNAYLTKPVDPAEFQQTIEALGLFWLEQAMLPPS